jgi:hypothetical protein
MGHGEPAQRRQAMTGEQGTHPHGVDDAGTYTQTTVDGVTLRRLDLPLAGSETIGVVVAYDQDNPQTVLIDYGAFLELWATLYVAVQTLKRAGLDPEDLTQGSHNGDHEGVFKQVREI